MIPPGVILTGELGDTALRPAWARDGSFLAFRKLQQLVPEFKKYLSDNAVQNAARTLSREEGADLLGARMVGRWRSGAPIDLSPEKDDLGESKLHIRTLPIQFFLYKKKTLDNRSLGNRPGKEQQL
jgi:deferrochelatase/peroxidase EfeB